MDQPHPQLEALTTMIMALVQSHPDKTRLLAAFEELSGNAVFRTPDTRATRLMHPIHAAHRQLRIHIDSAID